MSSLLIRAKHVVTCAGDAAQDGVTFERLGWTRDGAVLCQDGLIAAVGPRGVVEAQARDADVEVIDVGDGVVVPGFVDAHTHPLFAGDRAADFDARLGGRPAPLGMKHTVLRTRAAIESDSRAFWRAVEDRLRKLLAHGTTTAEVKTGYVLTASGELALLDGIAELNGRADLPRLIATFLGAHAVPPEYGDADAYVDALIVQALPHARAHGARYADVFCEPGFFTPAQSERYLAAARRHGLRVRAHCDEFASGGATAVACSAHADAVDHVNCISSADVAAIARGGATAVVCPATIAYLGLESRAPVRELLRAGAPVALASDFNPGTSPCYSLQHVAHLGRRLFGLSAAEALYAVTRASAYSLREPAGQLAPGMTADLAVLDLEHPEAFGVAFGVNDARLVVRAGHAVSPAKVVAACETP